LEKNSNLRVMEQAFQELSIIKFMARVNVYFPFSQPRLGVIRSIDAGFGLFCFEIAARRAYILTGQGATGDRLLPPS